MKVFCAFLRPKHGGYMPKEEIFVDSLGDSDVIQDNATKDVRLSPNDLTGKADESEPKGEKVDEKSTDDKGESSKEKTVKAVYTPDELEALLQSEGEIDTSRLSPEGKLLMKSFQRGFDQKFQQLAELRKRLEGQVQQRQPNKWEALVNEYMQNPAQVNAEIMSHIKRLVAIDPTDPNYAEAQRKIVELQEVKDRLVLERQERLEGMRRQELLYATAKREILEAIPDFERKAPKLTEFAVGLGLSNEEIETITDPTKFGPLAVKLTKVLNKVYDKLNASQTAEGKVKKDAPTPLVRAGSGGELEKTKSKDPSEMSMSEYRKWREKKS
jgi:hypothetical protein